VEVSAEGAPAEVEVEAELAVSDSSFK